MDKAGLDYTRREHPRRNGPLILQVLVRHDDRPFGKLPPMREPSEVRAVRLQPVLHKNLSLQLICRHGRSARQVAVVHFGRPGIACCFRLRVLPLAISFLPLRTSRGAHRLSVRTSGFHPGKRGSTPRGRATREPRTCSLSSVLRGTSHTVCPAS